MSFILSPISKVFRIFPSSKNHHNQHYPQHYQGSSPPQQHNYQPQQHNNYAVVAHQQPHHHQQHVVDNSYIGSDRSPQHNHHNNNNDSKASTPIPKTPDPPSYNRGNNDSSIMFSKYGTGGGIEPRYVSSPQLGDGANDSPMLPRSVSSRPFGGLVFLQYQGETKRTWISESDPRNLDDVRRLFLRCFAQLTPDYVASNQVKVYIQELGKSDLFYELEDCRDIRDKSVLKLHDQVAERPPPLPSSNTIVRHPSVPPIPTTSASYAVNTSTNRPPPEIVDDLNYFSEPEFDSEAPYTRNKRHGLNGAAYYAHALTSHAANNHVGSPATTRRYRSLDNGFRRGGSYPFPPPKPQRPPSSNDAMLLQQSSGNGYNNLHDNGGAPSINGPRYSGGPARFPQSHHLVNHHSDIEVANYDSYNGREISEPRSAYSDRDRSSSGGPRSGSITPIIDDEARMRMDHMEKQLQSLNTLVHTALMSQAKTLTNSVYRDIEQLRRDIFANSTMDDNGSENGSVSRFSDMSSDKGSYHPPEKEFEVNINPYSKISRPSPLPTINQNVMYPSNGVMTSVPSIISEHSSVYSTSNNSDHKEQLRMLRRRVRDLNTDLRHLRRTAQIQAQQSRAVLKDTFERIRVILNTNKQLQMFAEKDGGGPQSGIISDSALICERNAVNDEQGKYRNVCRKLDQDLNDLEHHIENLRQLVVSGDRKLRLHEVENFTENLTQIGRTAANLKSEFPLLHQRLKDVMTAEMENVIYEEKFIKDEPDRIDSMLRRCKKLTSTLVTMKKLALVQDPVSFRTDPRPIEQADTTSPSSSSFMHASSEPIRTTKTAVDDSFELRYPSVKAAPQFEITINASKINSNPSGDIPIPVQHLHTTTATSTTATSNNSNSGGGGGATSDAVMLDSLLEELQTAAMFPSGGAADLNVVDSRVDSSKSLTAPSTTPLHANAVVFNNVGTERINSDKMMVNGYHHSNNNINNNMVVDQQQPLLSLHAPPVGRTLMPYKSTLVRSNSEYSATNSTPNNNGNNSVINHVTLKSAPMSVVRTCISPPPSINHNTSMSTHAQKFLDHNHQHVSATMVLNGRSRSGTPTSVSSEPIGLPPRKPPPPPPPRSSSRGHLNQQNGIAYVGSPQQNAKFNHNDVQALKRQLVYEQHGRGGAAAARQIIPVQTNAVDEERLYNNVKSASSSESVNSQEGGGGGGGTMVRVVAGGGGSMIRRPNNMTTVLN